MIKTTAIAALALAAGAHAAAPFTIPVNDAASNLEVELCIVGTCDTDDSPVTGSIEIELDDIENPTQITLHDLNLQLSDDLQHNISFGFLGNFSSTTSNAAVIYGQPGIPTGPAAVVAEAFKLTNVVVQPEGDLNYNATGLACTGLQGAGLPCNDAFDLAANGPISDDSLPGQLTSVNRTVTITVTVDVEAPLDPADPSLGSYRISGTVTGAAFVPPCEGDANGDDSINFDDLNEVLFNWSQTVTPGTNGDVTEDGVVDFDDLNEVLFNWGAEC